MHVLWCFYSFVLGHWICTDLPMLLHATQDLTLFVLYSRADYDLLNTHKLLIITFNTRGFVWRQRLEYAVVSYGEPQRQNDPLRYS